MYLHLLTKVPYHRQVHVQVFLQHLLKHHLLQHLLHHPLALQHLQFQILHGHGDLQAHIHNQRGHHNRRANAVQAFSVRSWRTRVQHHLHPPPSRHATVQHLGHGDLQAHMHNRRGHRSRSANAVVTVAMTTIQLLLLHQRILSVRLYTRCRMICRACWCN